MSNQKTTELRKLQSNEVAIADLIPIVDISETTSPTGETKAITAANFARWMAESGIIDLAIPFQGLQTSNGLSFDESVAPIGNINKYCYTPFPSLGDEFTLYVRGFVPSTIIQDPAHRVIFGAGASATTVGTQPHSAYIGISNMDLIGYVRDGATFKQVQITDFFSTIATNPSGSLDRVFGVALSKDSSGTVKMIVNGIYAVTASSGPGAINSSYLTMGCGQSVGSHNNINLTVYEAHVFNAALTPSASMQLFYGGAKSTDNSIIASYTPDNLNPGPSQWLDCVGSCHLLLPTVGARATNPYKRFNLSFQITGSGYLGDGTARAVLPDKYVLTSCLVESNYKPLISVGSSPAVAPVSSSGTGSWRDNRVPFTSASYGINPLGIVALGAAHRDNTLYVAFSGSSYPCTFSFDGYTRI